MIAKSEKYPTGLNTVHQPYGKNRIETQVCTNVREAHEARVPFVRANKDRKVLSPSNNSQFAKDSPKSSDLSHLCWLRLQL